MSNNKKSSVEWLYEKLLNCELNIFQWQKHLEQAKAMHKEEIEKTYIKGYEDKDFSYFDPEQYYNEIFGGEQ